MTLLRILGSLGQGEKSEKIVHSTNVICGRFSHLFLIQITLWRLSGCVVAMYDNHHEIAWTALAIVEAFNFNQLKGKICDQFGQSSVCIKFFRNISNEFYHMIALSQLMA